MIQEAYVGKPWKVLVATLLVQRTKGAVALPVVRRILRKFPTAPALHTALEYTPTETSKWLHDALKPLGFASKRVQTLTSWADAMAANGDPASRAECLELLGVGPYTADCYSIFALGEIPERVTLDSALSPWVAEVREKHGNYLPWRRKRETP